MDWLYEVLTTLADEILWFTAVSNHSDPKESEFDPDGENVNLAATARRYLDIVGYAFSLVDQGDGPIYWRLRNWHHRLNMVSVRAVDPFDDEEELEEELRPGEVISFVRRFDSGIPIEGPYETDEENLAFLEAQSSGYTREMFGEYAPDFADSHGERDLDSEGAWAEYLEPEGMAEFYGSPEWNALRGWTKWIIKQADERGITRRRKWAWVRDQIRGEVEESFSAAVRLYMQREINVVAMAVIVHRFVSATKFSREEMVELTKVIPARSHIDDTDLGVNLFSWMQDHREELDDIIEDGAEPDTMPRFPDEEAEVAGVYDRWYWHQIQASWEMQAQARTPVMVEAGQKIWASCFMGMSDVEYNLAFFQAVANGLTKGEAQAAAEHARRQNGWVPNNVITSADVNGLIVGGRQVVGWNSAVNRIGSLTVEPGRLDGLVKQLRELYLRLPDYRVPIAAIGQAIQA